MASFTTIGVVWILKDTEARNGVIYYVYPAITPGERGAGVAENDVGVME